TKPHEDHRFASVLRIRSPLTSTPQNEADFGFGTLAEDKLSQWRIGSRPMADLPLSQTSRIGIMRRELRPTYKSWERNDLLLRNPGSRRPCHDCGHTHQCRTRQCVDLPQ